MTKDVVTVGPENNIIKIVKAILKYKIHSVPVVDEKGAVIGIVSEKDLFTKEPASDYLPLWIDLYGIARYQNEVTPDDEVKKLRIVQVSAADIMSTDVVTINEDEDVSELLQIFRDTKYKTIPVVDEDNILKGIVSLVYVIRKVNVEK